MRYNKAKTLFFFRILFGLCCYLVNIAYAETIDTQLSRDKIALGETVIVSYILNRTPSTSPDFSPLEKDFRILGSHYGSAINMLNGVTNTQIFWKVTLEPKIAGELIIPEIDFGNVKSVARKLLVEETIKTNSSGAQSQSTFVQATLSTTSPYVQSQVLYTFKLFYRSQLENPRIEPLQIKDGMLVVLGSEKFSQTQIKGESFFVFEKNFAFFPQKPGKFTIPPVYFRALKSEMSYDAMNDFFAVPKTEPVVLATKSFTLDVQKIPDVFQGKVWLPAKNIALSEKWSAAPDQWELGNPITRTITITAQGLRADQIPDIAVDNISGVNVYADPPHRSNNLQGNSVVGVWEQKITYIPNLSQPITIPALTINWWNTQTNTNASSQLKPISVQVKVKNNQAEPTPASVVPLAAKNTSLNATTNSASTNSSLPSLEETKLTRAFYLSIWFWVSILLLVIWLITLWLFLRKKVVKMTQLKSNSLEFCDKNFKQACEQGDSISAQKLLLLWAETHFQEPPRNLAKLREEIDDENFNNALAKLEQALYGNKKIPWQGHDLVAAYQQVQKNRKHKSFNLAKDKITPAKKGDPLPPLNP